MITTVIVWAQDPSSAERNPSESQIDSMHIVANTIAPGYVATVDVYVDFATTLQTTVRTWPTAETATAWVDYITANFTVESAKVCLDTVDVTDFGALVKKWVGTDHTKF